MKWGPFIGLLWTNPCSHAWKRLRTFASCKNRFGLDSLVLRMKVLVLGVLAFVLASCNSNPFIIEVTDCPAVAFVKYANTVTTFADGSEKTVNDVAYRAHLADLNVQCQDEGEGVRTAISFTVNGEKGPKAGADAIDISYFVVVLREGDQLVGKRIYDTNLQFRGRDQSSVRERVMQVIPNDTFADQYDHEVLIGFQLSDADAAYNILR